MTTVGLVEKAAAKPKNVRRGAAAAKKTKAKDGDDNAEKQHNI